MAQTLSVAKQPRLNATTAQRCTIKEENQQRRIHPLIVNLGYDLHFAPGNLGTRKENAGKTKSDCYYYYYYRRLCRMRDLLLQYFQKPS